MTATIMYKLVDRKPVPCENLTEWMRYLGECLRGENIIRQETAKNGLYISTLFTGICHSIKEDRTDTFETMVFDSNGSGESLACVRANTWEEAEANHHAIVKGYAMKLAAIN